MYPRLVARARSVATHGFSAVCVELPGAGDWPRLPGAEQAREVTIPLHVLLQ
ncbi:MAG: hypothetical protein QM597_01265 [Aeromicrobium sp.]|uniref:hypothetical protein n=1 Tax=Aeromicrobium sp. TaxID=1871063 RepID=UPI0039E68AED